MSEPTLPQIFTYAADNPETPARIRYAAAMDQSGPGMHWIAFGPTREQARDNLRKIWERTEGPNKAEALKVARAERKALREAAERQAPAPEAEDVGDVL